VKPTTDRERVRLAAAGPDGVSMRRIIHEFGICAGSGAKHVLRLTERGAIFRSDRRGCHLRFFNTQERADEWAAMAPFEPNEWAVANLKSIATKRKKAGRVAPAHAENAPVVLRGKPSDMRGPVDYSKAKVTICPPPPTIYRHEYSPASAAHQAYVRRLEELRKVAA